MNASELLSAGLRLFARSLLRCLPWSLLAVVAGQAPRAWAEAHAVAGTAHDAIWWLLTIVGGLANVLLFGLIVLLQRDVARNRPESLVAQLTELVAAGPALLLTVLPAALPLLLVAGLLGAGLQRGAVIALLPALYASVSLGFAGYERLLAGRGPQAAWLGSLALTRGHWWRIAGILLLSLLVLMVLYAVGGLLAMLLLQFLPFASSLLVALVAAIFLPLAAAIGHVLYADLCQRQAANSSTTAVAPTAP